MPPRGAALCVAVAAFLAAADAATSVSVTSSTIGTSPSTMGINAGHAYSESNWEMWLDRLGVNGMRLFLTPRKDLREMLGSTFGKNLAGDTVSSQTRWKSAVAQLRTPHGHDPAVSWNNPIMWREYDRGLEKDKVPLLGNPNNIVSEMRSRGISVQAQIALTCTSVTKFKLSTYSTSSSTYWIPELLMATRPHPSERFPHHMVQERWELYKYVYGLARWMWVRKIANIELYNEPNLDTGCDTTRSWLDNFRIRAAAVRNAYSDLNGETSAGNRITVRIAAPTYSSPRYSGTLGETSVKSIHAQFPSGSSSSWKNFDRYTFHVAGGQGYYVAANYNSLAAGVRKSLPGFPVDVTEYNTLAGSSFEKTTQTMDTAEQSADFGDIAGYLLPLPDRSFVFKFSQTPKSGGSGIQKNGLMFGENSVSPYNLGDSTRTFEVYQTIMDHCLGGKQLYKVTVPEFKRSQFSSWGCTDGKNRYLYIVNDYSDAKSLSISLSKWGVASGAQVLINEISGRYQNQIASVVTVGSSKKVSYSQPGFAVSMLTVPMGSQPKTLTRTATADATVMAGSNSGKKYGGLGTLAVKLSSSSTHDLDAVSFIKFDTGISASRISAAYLELYITGSTSSGSNLLVLGVTSSWYESSITWNNAPNLKSLANGKTVTRIADNPIDYNPRPKVAGHITVAGNKKGAVRVDVTHFLKAANLKLVSFQISRIVRFNKNAQLAGDSLGSNGVTFSSRQAQTNSRRPKLVLFYS